jgi:predicted nucleotidyltransferase
MTSLRAIPAFMDADIVASIDARLDAIRRAHGVSIPLAVESGSRAWGFPSPDSDYDCRFFFIRSIDDYLSPWQRRDVIETPLEGAFDVNGWDLGKAVRLLLKGNATVIEWLTSPITYEGDGPFREEMLTLAKAVARRNLVARHYLHLGERQRRAYFIDGKPVPQKKIFYALRPASALRWLRHHPGEAVAPMHFPTLMAECSPPAEIMAITEDLMARKAVARELGEEPLPPAIGAFIDSEFDLARGGFGKDADDAATQEDRARAEAFHLAALRRLAPDRG